MEKVLFSWSGGKDSAMALHQIKAGGEFEIAALLTTVTGDYDRISMHGVRRALLEQQAQVAGSSAGGSDPSEGVEQRGV